VSFGIFFKFRGGLLLAAVSNERMSWRALRSGVIPHTLSLVELGIALPVATLVHPRSARICRFRQRHFLDDA